MSRWRRFALRLRERFTRAVKGVLLWALPSPYLRYLPLPYPSTGAPDCWLRQGQDQVAAGNASRRRLDMGYTMDRFTYKNLTECAH